tara:strand:+ start:43 stop:690 length:648 start_codon:yes stop_codon:yes gene_type:complete
MHNQIINNFLEIKKNLKDPKKEVKIIAVSKTFDISHIKPLIDHGHNHFGENKVQEAKNKWTDLKKNKPELKIHLVGKLQSNKVKYIMGLFDYIHSLDNLKLAYKLSEEEKKKNLKLKYFIQINIGNEIQKSGVNIQDLKEFYKECTEKLKLDVIGFMCIPPNEDDVEKYFSKMRELKNEYNLKELSMGMSSDYLSALKFDSTFIRIGSKIFGERS